MHASERIQRWWQSPLAVQILGTLIGGLILAVIIGVVSDLDFGEVLVYVVLPVAAIIASSRAS